MAAKSLLLDAFNECIFTINDKESQAMTSQKELNTAAAEKYRLNEVRLNELKRRQIADLSTPCVAPILLVKAGIPRTATNNWNARGEFQSEYALDADRHRDGHRLYSPRDSIFLMGVWEFASIGVPLPVAKKAARLAVDIILNLPWLALGTRAGAKPLVLFRRDSEWCLTTGIDPFYYRGIPAKAVVYRDSTWRDDLIEGKDIPALRVVFNVGEFGNRVMSKIGRRLLSEEDFREPATEQPKPRRARKGKEG